MRRFITLQLIKLAMMMCASGFTHDHLTEALRAEKVLALATPLLGRE